MACSMYSMYHRIEIWDSQRVPQVRIPRCSYMFLWFPMGPLTNPSVVPKLTRFSWTLLRRPIVWAFFKKWHESTLQRIPHHQHNLANRTGNIPNISPFFCWFPSVWRDVTPPKSSTCFFKTLGTKVLPINKNPWVAQIWRNLYRLVTPHLLKTPVSKPRPTRQQQMSKRRSWSQESIWPWFPFQHLGVQTGHNIERT